MGKDDFMKLLIQQMRNQDPLDPMKGTEFASQLAQFSSVEQLSNIQTSLNQSLDANYLLSSSINNALAATFVGKDAKAALDKFHYQGAGEQRIGYTLPANASTVEVKIYDSSGTLVRTINGNPVGSGDHDITWDGLDNNGNQKLAGDYHFDVTAKDANGKAMDVSKYFIGTITSVKFRADGSVFIINGTEVPLAEILEVIQGGIIDGRYTNQRG
jgi:flagellar basal-body rod modification protein FlgD